LLILLLLIFFGWFIFLILDGKFILFILFSFVFISSESPGIISSGIFLFSEILFDLVNDLLFSSFWYLFIFFSYSLIDIIFSELYIPAY